MAFPSAAVILCCWNLVEKRGRYLRSANKVYKCPLVVINQIYDYTRMPVHEPTETELHQKGISTLYDYT
jgi:hypothetical protein